MSDIYTLAINSIMEQDQGAALEAVKKHLDAGGSPDELLNKGFIPGITKVAELFGSGRMFLPELMISAEVMSAAVKAMNEARPSSAAQKSDIVMVAATVKGDLHDIGKGIGVAMYRANGWKVIDLGRDVDVSTLVEAAAKNNANVIGTSALLTTTMPEQKKLEEQLKAAGLKEKVITMVAGAPVTQRWATRIGADLYCEDAHDAVVKISAAVKARK